jgi:hypothetical protein
MSMYVIAVMAASQKKEEGDEGERCEKKGVCTERECHLFIFYRLN